MPKESIIPDPARKPPGFVPATKIGNLLFVSGQTGTDDHGKVVGGMPEQAVQTFKRIEDVLRAAGATMDDVLKIACFLVRADDYKEYSRVREQVFSPDAQPASSTVVVKQLVRPELLIEIEAIASIG